MTLNPPARRTPNAPHSTTERSRADYRRVLWASLGISAVLHVLALFFYQSLLIKKPSVIPSYGPSVDYSIPEGTELVNLRELPDEPDEAILPPEEEPEPEPVQTPAQAPSAGAELPPAPGATQGPGSPSAAEILRPKAGDLRIWAPVDPEITRLSDEELMRILLMVGLEAVADSMALADEAARRSMDWTYTDEEGKRWGVSPGKIHLGDVTIPMPFGFGASPFTREQNGARMWAWDDIERGAARKGVQDVWKERAEAIRRRKNAERRPDTTGIRRN